VSRPTGRTTRDETAAQPSSFDGRESAAAIRDRGSERERGGGGEQARPARDPGAAGASAADAAAFATMLADSSSAGLDGGFDAGELGVAGPEVAEGAPKPKEKKPQPARKAWGGTDGGAGASVPTGAGQVSAAATAGALLRTRRAERLLRLHEAAGAARALGLLPGFLGDGAAARIEGLPNAELARIAEAIEGADVAPLLMRAWLTFEPAGRLGELRRGIEGAGESVVATVLAAHGAPDVDPDALRARYDVRAALFPPGKSTRGGVALPRPAWARSLPRDRVELSVLAAHRALTGDLSEDEPTGDGASDALTSAWATAAGGHPALDRWCFALAAHAETTDGLRDAMTTLYAAGG
jgi:hypothetical protein